MSRFTRQRQGFRLMLMARPPGEAGGNLDRRKGRHTTNKINADRITVYPLIQRKRLSNRGAAPGWQGRPRTAGGRAYLG